MKRNLHVLPLCAAALCLTSCASILCGSKKKVTFESNIPIESATLTIDGHRYTNVTFPFVAKVKRGFNDTIVKAECKGYENDVSVINLIDILG